MKAERTMNPVKKKPCDRPCHRDHEFTLVMSEIPELTDSITDALFEAGCDDSTVGMCDGRLSIGFSRAAPTLKEAIFSAICDVRKAKIGADVLRVEDCSIITQSEIARRIGRSRQLVHQYITGARGKGKFPSPAWDVAGGPRWFWCDVAEWLVKNNVVQPDVLRDAEEVEAINSVLDLSRQQRERSGLLKEVVRSLLPKKLSASLLSALK